MKYMKNMFLLLFMAIITLCIIGSLTVFANETEQTNDEIIKSAYESYMVYDVMNGFNSFSEDDWFLSKTIIFDMIDINENKEYNFGHYIKTVFEATTSDEVFALIDQHYTNYEKENMWVFADTECDNYDINNSVVYMFTDGKIKDMPIALIIDGFVYTYTHIGLAYGSGMYPDFENAVVISADGTNAIVSIDVVSYEFPSEKENGLTIELTKEFNGWKISGGTLFTQGFISGFHVSWFSDAPPPQTGENTFFYIVISASALACMTTLLVKRKRERV